MLVGLVVPVHVSGHFLLCGKTLVTLLTVKNDPGHPCVNGFVPLQPGRPVKNFTAADAGVILLWSAAFWLFLFLNV